MWGDNSREATVKEVIQIKKTLEKKMNLNKNSSKSLVNGLSDSDISDVLKSLNLEDIKVIDIKDLDTQNMTPFGETYSTRGVDIAALGRKLVRHCISFCY